MTLHLDELFDNVDDSVAKYTFAFKTRELSLSFDFDQLQSYDEVYQYLDGVVKTSDYVKKEDAQRTMRALSDDRDYDITWKDADEYAKEFFFTLDSIERKKEDFNIKIKWNGDPIGLDISGSDEVEILGRGKFEIIETETRMAPDTRVTLNFSESLDPSQNLKGLITVDGSSNLSFEVNGNLLHIYPSSKLVGRKAVEVHEGIKSATAECSMKKCPSMCSSNNLNPKSKLSPRVPLFQILKIRPFISKP